MQIQERAKLLQDEQFIVAVADRARHELFNQWIAEPDAEERDKLHAVALAMDTAMQVIAKMANEFRRGKND